MEIFETGWKTKKNHFVPQIYLEGFEKGDGTLVVWDKSTNNSFTNIKENVGYKKNIYNGIHNGEKISFENYFTNNVDNLYREIIQKIKSNLSCYAIDKPLERDGIKDLLSNFIANQIMRVPTNVMKGYIGYQEIFDTLDNLLIQDNKCKELKEKRALIKEYRDENAYKYFFFESLLINGKNKIPRLKNIIKEKVWILLKNTSVEPFLTSDNPVVVYDSRTGNIDSSIRNDTSIIIFPLSSELCLCLLSKNYVENHEMVNGKCICINDKLINTIEHLNLLQVNNCDRFTYGKM